MLGVYWGADMDSSYSGARRGIGASVGIGAPRGCQGAILGMSGDIRGVGVYWGLSGTVGTQGPEGV